MDRDWNALANDLADAVVRSGRLAELLEELDSGLEELGDGTYFRGPCPIHGGDGDNLILKTEGNELPVYWHCVSNHCHQKYKPSLLGFVRGVLSTQRGRDASMQMAVRRLRDFIAARPCGGGPPPSRPRPQPVRRPEMRLTRDQVRSRLVIPASFYLRQSISARVLDEMDVGYSEKLGRTVVPFYDDSAEFCIGYIARSEAGVPKWVVPRGFEKDSYLYGYAAARQSQVPFVVVVEGAGDVLRALDAGYSAVAILGTWLSARQAQKVAELGKPVVVCLDNDEAGRGATGHASERLRDACGFAVTEAKPWEKYKDVGQMPTDAAAAFLAELYPPRMADL